MFTGIILGFGKVAAITPMAGEVRLSIEAQFDWDSPLVLGESISVSGSCLTVTGFNGRNFTAHVSAETLSRTTLGQLKPGHKVNLERALRLSDRLGGHLVSGHIDGLGVIKEKQPRDQSLVFTFSLDPELSRFVIEKGSVAIDGISLTVNRVASDAFTVNIIPHTASLTTLGFKKVGDYVNVETDLIGKYVAKFVLKDEEKTGIDVNFLAEHGFL